MKVASLHIEIKTTWMHKQPGIVVVTSFNENNKRLFWDHHKFKWMPRVFFRDRIAEKVSISRLLIVAKHCEINLTLKIELIWQLIKE